MDASLYTNHLPMGDKLVDRNFRSSNDQYRAFAESKDQCRACCLFGHYQQVVQSEGCVHEPTFMFIGEAPGDDEAQINRPFVGRAGQRLRKELKKHACFSPDTTLISNLLPCRPLNNQFPSGKAGGFWINESCSGQQRQVNAADLITNCAARWIEKEIELVEPKILVTMGNPALQYVRGQKGITKHRGVWVFVPEYGLWSFAIYHPSYVIRSEGAGVGGDVPQHFTDDVAKIASEWEGILDNKIV